MPARLCACGEKLSAFNKSSTCFKCRQRNSTVTRVCAYEPCSREFSTAKAKSKFCGVLCWLKFKSEQRQNVGDCIVHSCLSNGELDPYDHTKCRCRLRVSDDDIKEAFRFNTLRNLNDAHRQLKFWTGGDVILIGKVKRPPTSSLGGRVNIERMVAGERPDVTPEDIARIQAIATNDREWLDAERRAKIEVENELALIERGRLIVFVDPETFDRERDASEGIPVVPLPVGADQRTLGGIGNDVRLATFDGEHCEPDSSEDEGAEAVEASEEGAENEIIEEAA
jgi:hypothetical protein